MDVLVLLGIGDELREIEEVRESVPVEDGTGVLLLVHESVLDDVGSWEAVRVLDGIGVRVVVALFLLPLSVPPVCVVVCVLVGRTVEVAVFDDVGVKVFVSVNVEVFVP